MANEPLIAPAIIPQPTPVDADWSYRHVMVQAPNRPDDSPVVHINLGVRAKDGSWVPGCEKTVVFANDPHAADELDRLIGSEAASAIFGGIVPKDLPGAEKHGVGGETTRDAGVHMIYARWEREKAAAAAAAQAEADRKQAEADAKQAEADALEAQAAALRGK